MTWTLKQARESTTAKDLVRMTESQIKVIAPGIAVSLAVHLERTLALVDRMLPIVRTADCAVDCASNDRPPAACDCGLDALLGEIGAGR